jgi:putative DNA primase/helicase
MSSQTRIPKRPPGFKPKEHAAGVLADIRKKVPDTTPAEIIGIHTNGDNAPDETRAQQLKEAAEASDFSWQWIVAAFNHEAEAEEARKQAEAARAYAGADDEDDGGSGPGRGVPTTLPPELREHFRPLGHARQVYYFLSHGSREVVEIEARSLAQKTVLYQLASRETWLDALNVDPDDGWGEVAADLLIGECKKVGPYQPQKVRGRGGYIDDGRIVFHAGNRLITDGQEMEIRDLETDQVYESGPEIDVDLSDPISAEEGYELVKLFAMPRWEKPESGTILAGWAFLAPIAGALDWRPHIYVTGNKQSGKSTVIKMVHQLLKETMLVASGKSTEAGIRQTLKSDALPIFIDEFEADNPGDHKKIQSVMELARQASSESAAKILRGSVSGKAMDFQARSMFAFSSINPNVQCSADESRVTTMTLRVPRNEDEKQRRERLKQFEELQRKRDNLLTDAFGDRMLARAVRCVPQIREAAVTFRRVVVYKGGDDRTGDQLGTLLAGAWMLARDHAPSEDDAAVMVDELGWDQYRTSSEDEDDDKKLIEALTQAQIRHDTADSTETRTVGELLDSRIWSVTSPYVQEDTENLAAQTLARHGIRVEEDGVWIAQNHAAIKRLLQGTQWGHTYKDILERVPGAYKPKKPARFAGSKPSKAVVVPHEAFVGDEASEADEEGVLSAAA